MSNRAKRCATVALSACAWLAGCAPSSYEPPTTEDVNALLSRFILRPDLTCSELAAGFGLGYLDPPLTPADAGMSYYETWIDSDPGVLLRLWYLPSKLDRGVVIISPGAGGSAPCYLFAPHLLVAQGWSVVLYDHRGFGLSTGVPAMEKLDDDLERVLDWTRETIGRPRVALMGISLGCIPVVSVAARRPEAVDRVILDSPVALVTQIERFESVLPRRASAIVAELEPDLRSDERVAELQSPLLVFIHGNDTLTPAVTEEALFANAPEPKEAVRFDDLPHAGCAYFDTDRYLSSIARFLESPR